MKKIAKKILINLHSHKKEKNDIIIFSLPRSGSTWLMEIINTQPNIRTIQEPLSLEKKVSILKYLKVEQLRERYQFNYNNNEANLIIEYFNSMSINKSQDFMYWADLFKKSHSFNTNRTLFKTHKITNLLTYFDKNLKIDIIYLIRHPIANIVSRIRNNWQPYISIFLNNKNFIDKINIEELNLIKQILREGSKFEKFIVSWFLENYDILNKIKKSQMNFDNNFMLLSYEQLYSEPNVVIGKLAEEFNLKRPDLMRKQIFQPSAGIKYSTNKSSDLIIKGSNDALFSWQDYISDNEINNAYELLKKLNIDLYDSKNMLPNEKYLIK